jgi:hypothetical protein
MDLTEKENTILEEMILGWPEQAARLWNLYLAIKEGGKSATADLTEIDRDDLFILEKTGLIEFEGREFQFGGRILAKPHWER